LHFCLSAVHRVFPEVHCELYGFVSCLHMQCTFEQLNLNHPRISDFTSLGLQTLTLKLFSLFSLLLRALRYYSDSPGIDSRWCHWGFFSWLHPTEPCTLGSTQPLKMSTRDFSWGKGGWCIRLTTYHPRSEERQENPGP
jgi:hypothetical protein